MRLVVVCTYSIFQWGLRASIFAGATSFFDKVGGSAAVLSKRKQAYAAISREFSDPSETSKSLQARLYFTKSRRSNGRSVNEPTGTGSLPRSRSFWWRKTIQLESYHCDLLVNSIHIQFKYIRFLLK